MNPLSVEDEYQNNPCLRREDITYLKEWLSKQPHLPDVPEDTLVLFLHSCDYMLEATKHTVDCHYTLKTQFPEAWTNRDPLLPGMQRPLRVVEFAALPGRDAAGNVVLIHRFVDTDPSNFVHVEILKAYAMFYDLMAYQAGLVPGFIMVFDQKGMNFGHAARLNISLLRNNLIYLQDGFPGKIIHFHIINCMPVTEKMVAMSKPFVRSEIMNKLIIHHSGLKSLYEYVPKKILPQEYGGNGGSFADLHKKTIEDFTLHRDWLLEEEKLRVDESKRIDPDKNSRNEFGISGSFRKLNLD